MVSSFAIGIIAALCSMVVMPLIIWAVMWWNSFKLPVTIAVQTGKDINSYVLRQDKFKVKEKNGAYVIIFRTTRGRSQSFPGELWQQFNMNGRIMRGLILYQTTEGEFHPLDIRIDGDKAFLKILSQDNREFIMNQTIEINKLTMTPRERLMTIAIIVVAAVVLGVMFILFLVYTAEVANNVCGLAANGGVPGNNETALSMAQGLVGA